MTQNEATLLTRVLDELTALRVDVRDVRERVEGFAEVLGHYETSMTAIEDAQECLTEKLEQLTQAVTSIGFLQDLDERTREATTSPPPGTA